MRALIRAGAKSLLEQTVARDPIAKILAHIRRRQVTVLAYHNIVPHGAELAGEWSLHLPQRDFSDQLDLLCETHSVVDLASALNDHGSHDRPRAVITFDDGYAGALTAGVDELAKRRLPATFFVCPGALQWSGFWWDLLADASTGLISPPIRERALAKLAGDQHRILQWARENGLEVQRLPPHCRIGSIEELRTADEHGLFSFGSHSWGHGSLPSLSEDELRDDLERTRRWLAAHVRHHTGWISYPYGLTSPRVERIGNQLHRGGLTLAGVLCRLPLGAPTRSQVPRVNVPRGISLYSFRLRLLGIP
jgi:peptidoglycan/xylan/chitin deacetylase (PgdA/CDA1 family)